MSPGLQNTVWHWQVAAQEMWRRWLGGFVPFLVFRYWIFRRVKKCQVLAFALPPPPTKLAKVHNRRRSCNRQFKNLDPNVPNKTPIPLHNSAKEQNSLNLRLAAWEKKVHFGRGLGCDPPIHLPIIIDHFGIFNHFRPSCVILGHFKPLWPF